MAVVPILRQARKQASDVTEDGDLKTAQSERILVIPDPYATRLLEIAEEGYVDGCEWLSPRYDGSVMSIHNLRLYWMRAAGADYIPFKNLRRSWRTFAQMEWGLDYDTCEVLMGHALKGVTGRHYLKPTREQLIRKVYEALGKR